MYQKEFVYGQEGDDCDEVKGYITFLEMTQF
jgi:hypothetical protein